MGFSVTFGNIVLTSIVLMSLTLIVTQYSNFIRLTATDAKQQTDHLKIILDSSIKITSMTTSGQDVIFLVQNDGSTDLRVNCTDFFIDRQYMDPDVFDEFTLLNTTFEPGVWNPDEILKVRTEFDTNDGQPHEGKVATCNGQTDSAIFYYTG